MELGSGPGVGLGSGLGVGVVLRSACCVHLALELLARDEDDVRVRVLGGELVALVRVRGRVRVRASG